MRMPSPPTWQFVTFGLLVTGRGEEVFAANMFRALEASHHCHFETIGRVPQLSPVTSSVRAVKIAGSGRMLPSKDVERIGLPARGFLRKGENRRVVLVDDLEYDRRPTASGVWERYRNALDQALNGIEEKSKAAVHFFVNMVEAYFLADAQSTNSALGTSLPSQAEDVESVRNPKGTLKRAYPGYDEIEHGVQVVDAIDMDRILSNPETCKALRTLFLWCAQQAGIEIDERFRLNDGAVWSVTAGQLPLAVDECRIQELS